MFKTGLNDVNAFLGKILIATFTHPYMYNLKV